jgi:beta-glucosidase
MLDVVALERNHMDLSITTFAQARDAVANGVPPRDAARALVGHLSEYERLWCLDGDAPTWAGLGFLNNDGYHKAVFVAGEVDRVGFPGIRFSDGPRGAVVANATAFPVTMARGATWDPDLEERIGEAIGRELRAVGANLTGAVCINLLRHPAWGRAQETYGEDPHHVGEMGAALTRGLQRHVMACVKHFACNSMENARFSVDITIDDTALHEVFLPHFRRVVDEGVASVMSAYNSVNGEWCGQNRELLTQILRDEWGFEGFVISDWILGLRDAAASVTAGLDVEMPYRMVRQQHLPAALARGELSWDDVDLCAERVIATLLRFDRILTTPAPQLDVLGAPGHRALAREVAARSAVLLRNEPRDGKPILPLEPTQSIAAIGRLADTVNLGDGGSSDVWDLSCATVLDGLRNNFVNVVHDDGTDIARATAAARSADAAVVVVGYTYIDEGEYIDLFNAHVEQSPATIRPDHLGSRPRTFSRGGDRTSLRLLPHDVELVRAVAAANDRTIVIIQAGSAVITTEWADDIPAIVQAWYGGSQAGPGLADVLVGSVNPSARLPFTVPVDEADLPAFDRDASAFTYDRWHGWWRAAKQHLAPAYPFGFGLSYTTFTITDVAVSVEDSGITVRGTLRNTGARDGADVVQVYAGLPDTAAPDRLIGFARIDVSSHAHEAFEISVPLQRLATRDSAHRGWSVPSGHHTIAVARYAGDPHATLLPIDL